MTDAEFQALLTVLCAKLTSRATANGYATAKDFEADVRQQAHVLVADTAVAVDFSPHPHAFPDIALGRHGIEVKFTINDSWRSVANSVLESHRIEAVKHIYIVFGKMGGMPEVRWGRYEDVVMHVRTSHVPRFEIEMDAPNSLFKQLGVTYDQFRLSPMDEKWRTFVATRKRVYGAESGYGG